MKKKPKTTCRTCLYYSTKHWVVDGKLKGYQCDPPSKMGWWIETEKGGEPNPIGDNCNEEWAVQCDDYRLYGPLDRLAERFNAEARKHSGKHLLSRKAK